MKRSETNVPAVAEIMTTRIVTLQHDLEIHEAIQVLLRHKISGAPVVNADEELVGILSEKDCLRMFVEGAYDNRPGGGKVFDYMPTKIVTCVEEDDLFAVASLFFKNSFRRLPVLRRGKLVGLISRSDVLKGSIKLWGGNMPDKSADSDSVFLTEEIKAALK